jgi:hypothetical protein
MAENAPPQTDMATMAKNQILNLQLYQPPKPKPDGPQPPPPASQFPIGTTYPFYPPHMANMMMSMPYMPGMAPQYSPIINKIYDIRVNGPADTHHRLNMIYEDVLPTKHIKNSYITIGDRMTQSNYIRSVLFPNGDGDEVGFSVNSRNNILEHIKFMDLNPYNTYRYSDNPYKGLPEGLLIYRSCYPIQRDTKSGMTICARNSMAVNIRVYRLTVGSYKINKQNKTTYADYDQWREVAYYEYIRERILKNKLCPNFVGMHGYYTTEKSDIDFDKVNHFRIMGRNKSLPTKITNPVGAYVKKTLEEQNKLTDALKPYISGAINTQTNSYYDKTLEEHQKVLNAMAPYIGLQQTNQPKPGMLFGPKQPVAEDLEAYKGSVLTIMTESPTYTLYNWASKIYQIEGNIKKMVNTGYHSDKVWMSIVFQLIIALYVLQLNKIIINNFSIRNNVYIKDVATESNVTNYWKYKINNLEYYIPNFGYILQIDTNFTDLNDAQNATFITVNKSLHKLDGKIYDDKLDDTQINNTIFDIFISCMNTNNFKGDFISEGGVAPPQEILSLLDKIHTEAVKKTNTNIGSYLINFMRPFMNNRIGTFLKEQEFIHIRKDDMRSAKTGQVVILDEGNGTHRFVLYVSVNNGIATILTKDENINPEEIIDKQVPVTSLFNFSRHEPIVQNYKLNEANLTEEAILETYTIIE